MASKLGSALQSKKAEKACAKCISRMVKNPDWFCKEAPGYKACVTCKAKATRCFPVPEVYDEELKVLMRAQEDYDLDKSGVNGMNVRALAEKLTQKLEQVISKTPSRAKKSRDMTAEGLADGSGTESPTMRQTRQTRRKSEATVFTVGDDDDDEMEDHPQSPREAPRMEPRNLFAVETRRPPVTIAADKPLNVKVIEASDIKRELDEILQVNTWTMRRSWQMVQGLTVSCKRTYTRDRDINMINRDLRNP